MRQLALFLSSVFSLGHLMAQQVGVIQPNACRLGLEFADGKSTAIPEGVMLAPLSSGHLGSHGSSRTMALSPRTLGGSSDAFSVVRTSQNQVYANDDCDFVCFVHTQDFTVFGGGAASGGKLRYDASIDNGDGWSVNNGVLNSLYTFQSKFPMITGHNAPFNDDPFNLDLIYMAPVFLGLSLPEPAGKVAGRSAVTILGATTSTEHYSDFGLLNGFPGGLSEGQPGEFWAADFIEEHTAAQDGDTLYVYKGVLSSGDITFSRTAFVPLHSTSFDGSNYFLKPNISFSPDGNHGWVAWLGDLAGGADSVFSPVLMRTTDGGDTWGAPMEVNLNSFPFVSDSLRTLWLDSGGAPLSTGRATAAFDFDLTVDKNGNPHFFTVVGSASTTSSPVPGYTIYSGLAKFAVDVTTTNGGLTWDARYIAPLLTLRGFFGTTSIVMDNYPQVARNSEGDHIFFSWVDTDTSVVGFGHSANNAPNLRIASLRVTDGFQTCYKMVTDGDLVWDGKILFPTMAPEVLTDVNGWGYSLPIVGTVLTSDDASLPVQYKYFGVHCYFNEGDYKDPSTLSLGWEGSCYGPANPVDIFVTTEASNAHHGALEMVVSPNPSKGILAAKFRLPRMESCHLEVFNMLGEKVATLASGDYKEGMHEMDADLSYLPSGIYVVRLVAGSNEISCKWMLSK